MRENSAMDLGDGRQGRSWEMWTAPSARVVRPYPERTVMRYASTYDKTGAPVVAEVQGDQLVPLVGLTELGPATTAEVLSRAPSASPPSPSPPSTPQFRPVVPNPARSSASASTTRRTSRRPGRSDSDYPVLFPKFARSLACRLTSWSFPPEAHEFDYEAELTVVIG